MRAGAGKGGVVGGHAGSLCGIGPAAPGDGQRRAGVGLEDLRELEASEDRPLPGVAGEERLADRQVPDPGENNVLRLIAGGDAALDGILLPRRAGAGEGCRNGIAGTEGAAIVDRARPGVVGHEGHAM